jgi:peptidoglycan/LPS O-acetylase OafA/YrhL
MRSGAFTPADDCGNLADWAGRRFITLDAMRGVAAIAVMMFHYLLGSSYHIFDHAFYAVDFFFILSGIVLTHAYARKIDKGMGFMRYMKARLIRLYPFYIIGSLLGIALYPSYMRHSAIIGFRHADYISSIVFGAAFLPYLNHGAVPIAGGVMMSGAVFPFNIPAWSLFFELVASIALFLAIRKGMRAAYVVGFSFIGLAGALWHYKTFNMGWGTSTILGGFPRTAFGLFFGVMMYQMLTKRKSLRIPLDPKIILGMTAILFTLSPSRWVLSVLIFAVAIPALMFFGLSVDDKAEQRGFFVWLGKISYGVYAIHFPVYRIVVVMTANTSLAPEFNHSPMLLACLVGGLVIVAAHLLTSFVDEPVRRWLNCLSLTPRSTPVSAIKA